MSTTNGRTSVRISLDVRIAGLTGIKYRCLPRKINMRLYSVACGVPCGVRCRVITCLVRRAC